VYGRHGLLPERWARVGIANHHRFGFDGPLLTRGIPFFRNPLEECHCTEVQRQLHVSSWYKYSFQPIDQASVAALPSQPPEAGGDLDERPAGLRGRRS